MAASSDGAEPSCRYGAVAHTSRRVGVSRPTSGPPRRCPLLGLSVPTSCKTALGLSVKPAPPWQLTQLSANVIAPAAAALVKLPLAARYGDLSKLLSDAT